MRTAIQQLPQISLRKIVLLFLVEVALLFGLGFINFGSSCQARAEALTPEATSYQVDEAQPDIYLRSEPSQIQAERAAKAEQKQDKPVGENVLEKLNLKEPLPESTKKFFKQIQGKEPIENETKPELNNQ